jgi:hypothetical protein
MMDPNVLAELVRQRHAELLRTAEDAYVARFAKAQHRAGRPRMKAMSRRLRALIRSYASTPVRGAERPTIDQRVIDLRGAPSARSGPETNDVRTDARHARGVAVCSVDE